MQLLPIVMGLSVACACVQKLNRTIVGCIDLECPPSKTGPSDDDCAVADHSFSFAGFARIPTENKDLKGQGVLDQGL
ncbi:hypothetical protein F4802DRAFT_590694 [Xylaria palmicola]|nr:hypothetical protein F4802DRAFT_590694 [Xylaria palmicola]